MSREDDPEDAEKFLEVTNRGWERMIWADKAHCDTSEALNKMLSEALSRPWVDVDVRWKDVKTTNPQRTDDTERLPIVKCKCGSGSNDAGPHHYDWCDLHKVYKDE